MIVYAIGIPLMMIAAVVDASVFSQLRYLNGQPSLVLLLVVSWGLLNELGDGLVWAFFGGLFADLLSITPTGTSSLAYAVSVFILTAYMGQVGRRNFFVPILAVILTTLIYQTAILGMLMVQGNAFPLSRVFFTWTLPSMLLNIMFIYPIFRVMGRIIVFFRPPKVGLG